MASKIRTIRRAIKRENPKGVATVKLAESQRREKILRHSNPKKVLA